MAQQLQPVPWMVGLQPNMPPPTAPQGAQQPPAGGDIPDWLKKLLAQAQQAQAANPTAPQGPRPPGYSGMRGGQGPQPCVPPPPMPPPAGMQPPPNMPPNMPMQAPPNGPPSYYVQSQQVPNPYPMPEVMQKQRRWR